MEGNKLQKLHDLLVNNFLYAGLKEEQYREIEQEIYEKERRMLSMVSICLMLMFGGLFIGSLCSAMMAPNSPAYGLTGLGFLVIFGLCQVLKGGEKKLVVPLWYVALTLIFGYAIILNTVIRNDISATTFCVIMVMAPMLLMDKPWRECLYFLCVICVFIPIDFHQKSYYLAYTDTVNALCCTFIGSGIQMGILRTRCREMSQRHYIEKQRDTDKLTGCLTKAAFEQKIAQSLITAKNGGVLAVMDVDYFKSVNDNYGHIFGDLVLRQMGEHICSIFPKEALCGRFGGDEFVVWMPGHFSKKEFSVYLAELTTQIRAIQTPDGQIQISSSMGIAICPDNGKRYSELFENADAALYTAKKLGRNRFVFCPDNCI